MFGIGLLPLLVAGWLVLALGLAILLGGFLQDARDIAEIKDRRRGSARRPVPPQVEADPSSPPSTAD